MNVEFSLEPTHVLSKIKTERQPNKFTNFIKNCLCCRRDEKEDNRNALMKKAGGSRVDYRGLGEYRRRYLADIYISLVDLPWRYAIAVLFNVFLVCYVIFAFLWWWMAYNNGDFNNIGNPNHEPCLMGIESFPAALLFSIETQTTIGYGFAYPNAECVGSLPLIYIQVTIGFFLETLLFGFIFVKLARPKYRANTIMFSKHAVICKENGGLCLQVRVGDLRKSHLVDAHITAMMIRRYKTEEGYTYPLYQHELEFEANGMADRIFLLWPLILTHRITEESPLWDVRPSDMSSENYEILVFLEGTVEATGECCQAKTSYTPKEILWGHRFERVEEYDIGLRRWHIDFTGFNDVIYCQNLRHSALELSQFENRETEPENPDKVRAEAKIIQALTPNSRYDLVFTNSAEEAETTATHRLPDSRSGAALLANEEIEDEV